MANNPSQKRPDWFQITLPPDAPQFSKKSVGRGEHLTTPAFARKPQHVPCEVPSLGSTPPLSCEPQVAPVTSQPSMRKLEGFESEIEINMPVSDGLRHEPSSAMSSLCAEDPLYANDPWLDLDKKSSQMSGPTPSACHQQLPPVASPRPAPKHYRQFLVHLKWGDPPGGFGMQVEVMDNHLLVKGLKHGVIKKWNERCEHYFQSDEVSVNDEIVSVGGKHQGCVGAIELRAVMKQLATSSNQEFILVIKRNLP